MNNKYCLLSCFLNPKYKNIYFTENQMNDVIGFIKEECNNESIETQNDSTKSTTQNSNNQFEEDDIMNYGIEQNDEMNVELTVDQEIEEYLRKERIGKNADIKFIVEFWERNKDELKLLYKLSQKYLVNLASSASSERLFSAAGNFFDKRRTRMLKSTLESECILKSFIENNGIYDLI